MARMQRVGSLEIDQDLGFERREWAVQRAGWVVVLLLLIGGLAGLLGPGPLSHVETTAGSLTVAYERFVRKRAPTELHIELAPGTAANGEVAIWIDQSYLSKMAINQVLPEPADMEAAGDGLILRFTIANPEQAGEISLDVEPAEPGMMRGQVGLLGRPAAAIEQFIFP